MLGKEADTIAAIATPSGVGGVGIIRVSGSDAIELVAGLVGRSVDALEDRRLIHGEVRDGDERLDEVLVVAMRGPHSFTGEDVAEIQGHGGPINMARLLRAVLERGARSAEAGEFTRRALQNGRLDLVRAEALVDVIEATSERAWRLAQHQLAGELGDDVRRLRDRATGWLAEVEAFIDFPEEGLGEVATARIAGELAGAESQLNQLIRSYELGKALTEGIQVALIGPTNAGKSSLFNMLVGSERAVVDEEPGTTRDYVEERLVIDGIPVCLIDTAGSRGEVGRAERKGIDLGRRRVERADVAIVMHPADGSDATEADLSGAQKRIDICSKSDLREAAGDRLGVSTVTGAGVEALRRRIVEAALTDAGSAETRLVITSERQRNLLVRAVELFASAREGLALKPLEVVAIDVRGATTVLAEVLGESVGEEVLDNLFARFCIGK